MNNIQQTAQRHSELIRSIQEVDYAPPTLKQVQAQLATATKQLDADKKALTKKEAETKKEFKDFQGIKDRTSKRLWVKIKNPTKAKEAVSAKEEKEEREYMQAFQVEQELKAKIAALEEQVQRMQGDVHVLSQTSASHDKLQAELQQLYDSVFGGPTPNHPEEDAAEQAAKAAFEAYNQVQSSVTNESRAFQLLKQAERSMAQGAQAISQAESYSTWDMMGGGGMADMMERSALSDAQRAADQANMYLQQARQLQPAISHIPGMDMPMGNLMSDVFFDNIFTDYSFHKKIQAAAQGMAQRQALLRDIIGQSQGHLNGLQQQLRQKEEAMDRTRSELERIRRDILLRALNEQQGGSGQEWSQQQSYAPPAYAPPPQNHYYGNPFADSMVRG